ncbi:MAG: peptidoglycan DD-metalloendopeptidase family protein [Hormoscilla sp.]
MNDNKNSNFSAPRTLLIQSLGWIGGLGVLSGGIVWAEPQKLPEPTLLPAPATDEPVAVILEPVVEPRPIPARNWEAEVNWASEPSWTPNPVRSAPEPEIMLAPGTAADLLAPDPRQAPVAVERKPAPAKNWEAEVNWASEPSWTPATVASEPQPDPVETTVAVEANSTDTAYGIGGSNSNVLDNQAPREVVLSPRNPAPVAYPPPAPATVRSRRSYQRPAWRPQAAPIPAWRPQYRRNLPRPQIAKGRKNSVNLGPASYSPSEIKYGDATPIGRSYYQYIAPNLRPDNGNNSIIFPLSIPSPITSLFGWRTHPIFGTEQFHHGTDIGAPTGTPVLAALAGKVAIADALKGYGLSVVLEHARSEKPTQQTLYAHLSEIFVQPGEEVKQGSIIGSVGSSGYSTGPHLHFELRELTSEGWVTLDPGAQLEYALAQLVKNWETAAVAPEAEENNSPAEKALKKLKKLGFEEIAPEDMPLVKVRKG